MCGRFILITPAEHINRLFKVELRLNLPPRYNIAPTQPVLVIRNNEARQRIADHQRWGLIPSWSKEPDKYGPLINARVETVLEKPSFRGPMRHHRCLIPADGFYEWQKMPSGPKQPWLIRAKDEQTFAFAAVFDQWLAPDGSQVDGCALLTQAAGPALASIHPRMPVMLRPEEADTWLEADDPRLLLEGLRPLSDVDLKPQKVSRHVNNVRHDDESCMTPA